MRKKSLDLFTENYQQQEQNGIKLGDMHVFNVCNQPADSLDIPVLNQMTR